VPVVLHRRDRAFEGLDRPVLFSLLQVEIPELNVRVARLARLELEGFLELPGGAQVLLWASACRGSIASARSYLSPKRK
jgi:hypothetical protein